MFVFDCKFQVSYINGFCGRFLSKITTTFGEISHAHRLGKKGRFRGVSVLYLQSALVIATVFQKDLLELHLGALPPANVPPSEIRVS